MADKTATVPVPHTFHPETLGMVERLLQLDTPDGASVLATYCPRHHVAGMYLRDIGLWKMFVPLSFGNFIATLGNHGIVIDPENEDHAKWIEACGLSPPQGAARLN